MHRIQAFAAIAVLGASLAGCSREADPATPAATSASTVQPAPAGALLGEGIKLPEATDHELMTANYGETYNPGKNRAHAAIENNDNYKHALLSFVSAQSLPGERTAVLVNGAPADEEGNDLTSHAASGVLNVYILRRNGQAWELLGRHERQGEFGSMGHIGEVKWTELGSG